MKKNTKEFQAGNFLHLRVAHPKNYLFRLKCNNHQKGNIKINDIKKKKKKRSPFQFFFTTEMVKSN